MERLIDRVELIEEARRVGFSESLLKRLYEWGRQDAKTQASRNRLHEEQQHQDALVRVEGSFRMQIESAENMGYQRGYQSGFMAGQALQRPSPSPSRERPHTHTRPHAPAPPPPRAPMGKSDLAKEVEEQYRVIVESNPSMKQGAMALRRMLMKKLR